MNLLLTIKDQDLGFSTPTPDVYKEREASRAVVFDTDKNVALLHSTINDYHKLPGGGVEKGEDTIDALRREISEEIGCNIKNIRGLGIIEEYRNKFSLHQTSYCFIADLDGEKGTANLTESEMADGFETVWMILDNAIKALEDESSVKHYEGKFIHKRDIAFLKAAKVLQTL
ncbi:MAG: NUDIX domain-containing protein [bacterium]|nr:NUDIX domain-containing protein [bacterium]